MPAQPTPSAIQEFFDLTDGLISRIAIT